MSIIPELKRSYVIPTGWIDFVYRPLFLMIQDFGGGEYKSKNLQKKVQSWKEYGKICYFL